MDEPLRLEFLALFNEALRLEHAAAIQYLAHAETINGINSPTVNSLFKDSAADEIKHADTLRVLICDYLLAAPALDMTPAKPAYNIPDALHANINSENDAIILYRKIHARLLNEMLSSEDYTLPLEKLAEDIRLILIEEQEHVAELSKLL